jgi:predicted RND superfamily exporter protein
MNRYIAEQKLGKSRNDAIRVTIKEIGLATLYTSLTTAIGFGTLATSRIQPIQSFGLNASVGVMIAYVTVIFFTTSLLTYFDADQLSSFKKGDLFWSKWMRKANEFTIRHPKRIGFSLLPLFLICALGISLISTNYTLESNLPMRSKITKDYLFFEENFAGFRPIELAVTAQDTFTIHDYEVMLEINKAEEHLRSIDCASAIMSPASIYKSIGQMLGGNQQENYRFPKDRDTYQFYKGFASQVPTEGDQILISSDLKRARVTSRFDDIGADTIKQITDDFETWLSQNTNSDVVKFKATGTAMIFDKNVVYVRESLLKGLGLAIVIVSLLMVFLFRNIKIIIISLIPNILPLVIAAALIGFIGIELEAGISIIFAMVFGIAVDDTIHFLSKYRITRKKGLSIDESIERTFQDTGKAICFTSVILFFGFMVMLFSVHPPSLSIGLMISLTLITALVCDLLFIPVLIRWLMPSKKDAE